VGNTDRMQTAFASMRPGFHLSPGILYICTHIYIYVYFIAFCSSKICLPKFTSLLFVEMEF